MLEERVREILNSPACQHIGHTPDLIRYRVRLRDCPVCLPKRIAAAIEAATHPDHHLRRVDLLIEDALAALKGEA